MERLLTLPRWLNTLIAIGALVGLVFAGQAIDHLLATPNDACGSFNPTCAVRPDAKLPATKNSILSPYVPPATDTPTTVQIVPIPGNNNGSNIPQPSFGPAP
jgi:hypothetical protein